METTLQEDIHAPTTALPTSTAVNIVLVGLSGVVPVAGTPTPVVPPVLMPPTSTAITLPVVTSSMLTSNTAVPGTSVLAPISFSTLDVTFPLAPTPIFLPTPFSS